MSEHEHEVAAMKAQLEELERNHEARMAFIAEVKRKERYRVEKPIPHICATCQWCEVSRKCPRCLRNGEHFDVALVGRCDAYEEYKMDNPALELAEETFGFLMRVQELLCDLPPKPEFGRLERQTTLALRRCGELLDLLRKEA